MTDKRLALRWVLVALVWLVPLSFFLSGMWPFGLFPAILLTLWVALSGQRVPHD